MNFLIFDTEQTYNYGYIVLDNDMKIILEEDADVVQQVEIYKNNLDKIYQVKAQNLEKERKELQDTVATLITKKIKPIIKFPFFNKELKYIKTLIANNDMQKLYEYFIKD